MTSVFLGASRMAKADNLGGNSEVVPSSWPMYRSDPAHTGFSSSSAPKSNETAWMKEVESYGEPVVSKGVFYVGGGNGEVYALNASTGIILRSIIVSESGGSVSSLAIVDSFLYCISGYNVYALNASTGATMWSYIVGGYTSPLVVANGMVYFGASDGAIYALNAITGANIWTSRVGAVNETNPCALSNNIVVVVSSGSVYALNATTGAQIWKYINSELIASFPIIANAMVFINGYDDSNGYVYALNATTGAQIWNYISGSGLERPYDLASSNGIVFFVQGHGFVHALNASTGANIWTSFVYPAYTFSNIPPAVADGVVYLPYTGVSLITLKISDAFFALNASTGAIIWSYDLGNSSATSAVIADGMVYTRAGGNNVIAFGSRSQPMPTPSITPTVTPTPSPMPTPTPTVTPTPSPMPTPTPTVTPTPSPMPTPTPTVTPTPSPMPTPTPTVTPTTSTLTPSPIVTPTSTPTNTPILGAPAIELTSPISNGSKVKLSSLQINWKPTDEGSTVDHYEVKLDDGVWTNIGTQTSYNFNGLVDGNHTFNIKVVGESELSQTYSINALVTAGVEQGVPLMYVGVVVAIIAVATMVALLGFKFFRKQSKLQ